MFRGNIVCQSLRQSTRLTQDSRMLLQSGTCHHYHLPNILCTRCLSNTSRCNTIRHAYIGIVDEKPPVVNNIYLLYLNWRIHILKNNTLILILLSKRLVTSIIYPIMLNIKDPFLPHLPSTQACPPVHASTVAEHLQMLFVASQKDAETSSTHELAVPHLQTKSVSVPSQVSGDWHAGLHAKTCQCIILIFATHFLYYNFYNLGNKWNQQ